MDPDRYATIRDLFLAAEEMPPEEQDEFLKAKAGSDQTLIEEVRSLLAEHDPAAARIEGESAQLPMPRSGEAPNDSSATQTADGEDDSEIGLDEAIDMYDTVETSSDSADANVSDPNLSAPGLPPEANEPQSFETRVGSFDSDRGFRKHSDAKKVEAFKSRSNGPRAAQATQHGSQRTHAAPRYPDDTPAPKRTTDDAIWRGRARRHRRFNSGWLWLAAILPTALVGWWTYRHVSASQRDAVQNELAGVADSVSIAVNQLLQNKAQMARSWSRQSEIQRSVIELVEIAKQDDSIEKLKAAEQSDRIRKQLRLLSGTDEIKFVVWDRAGMILASWLDDRADVGSSVSPSGAANLARAMRGETVLFGPEILVADTQGFVPETTSPVMAEIVPIYSDDNRIVAVMLIRGFNMFEEFDSLFRQSSSSRDLDVYAINRAGQMISNSPDAQSLAMQEVLKIPAEEIAVNLRVSDPQVEISREVQSGLSRQAQPLTYSVAGASSGQDDTRIEPYNNYAGVPVVGAWRWHPRWNIGVIVEKNHANAFATARIVQYAFLCLGALLSITALIAAAQIARRTAMAQVATHPLSRYELINELGSGGMGIVYKARHKQLGRDAALKVLRGDRQNRDDRLRFDREARLAASLSSPHTVTIYDYGRSEEDEAFCVMEFLQGITLYDVVSRSGHQPYGRVLCILRQICDSLGEAHSLGLVHRDIKPQNVMLSLDASVGDWAVVFDFGLAKPLRPDPDAYQTAETIWAGTPMYMAPERYREPNKMDPRSDIYSVGCIAYFLLSGRPPFIECDPESLFALVLTEQPISIDVHRDEIVPQEIVDLVNRCMAKNVDQRFESIDALGEHVDALREKFLWSTKDAKSWWRIHGEEL